MIDSVNKLSIENHRKLIANRIKWNKKQMVTWALYSEIELFGGYFFCNKISGEFYRLQG